MGIVSEFKTFINRGNVVDMAVGVIIGGAFTSVVTSFTGNIINPLINFVTGTTNGVPNLTIAVPGTSIVFDFGAFFGSIINFLIVALTVFFVMKAFNKAQEIGSEKAISLKKLAGKDCAENASEKPAAPVCPFCLEEIKVGATRCPHCTGVLPRQEQADSLES